MKTAGIIAGIVLMLGGFIALALWADLDVAKWFTCSGPLAQPEDQKSHLCRETDDLLQKPKP